MTDKVRWDADLQHLVLDVQWFTAVYAGFIGALYWCIVINGFVGFQFAEDGTPMSLWVSFLPIASSISCTVT
jgi:hypothetical protein